MRLVAYVDPIPTKQWGFCFSNFYVCPTVNVSHCDFCTCDFSEKLSVLGR